MNKKCIISLFVSLFVLTAAVTAAAAENIPFLVSGAAKSVVRITVNNSFGTDNVSGIVIDKEKDKTYVMTSFNAVNGADSMSVDVNGQESIPAAGIIASSKEKNIAVIELTQALEDVRSAKLKDGDMKNGQDVYVLKYYCRDNDDDIYYGTVTSKNIFQSSGGENCEIYQITAQINADNNGGPIVDKYGNVTGINFYDGNTSLSKAVTSSEAIKLFDEKEVPYKKATYIYFVLLILGVAAVLCAGGAAVLQILKNKKKNMPYLVGISGEFSGKKMPVGKENISIGRDAKYCQVVVLGDEKVSRCHCSIHYDAVKNLFVLTDLASTHGTYINEATRIEPKMPVYLENGSTFKIGGGINVFSVSIGGDMI